MPQSPPPYPPEYRQHILELVRSGRTPEALARACAPSAQGIRAWVKAAERAQSLRSDGLTQTEHEARKRLRRAVKLLRQEQEILKKPRPPSPGRAMCSLPRLRVRSGAPGRRRCFRDVPCSGRLPQWLLRLAHPPTVGASPG